MSGDLPTAMTRVNTGSQPFFVEAIGTGPYSERYVSSVNLYSVDAHSGTSASNYIVKNSDGTIPYSCERWVRIRFSPPFGSITKIRFWVDNYVPVAGWEVNWGRTFQYNTPRLGRSSVALSALPVVDPGPDHPNVDIDAGETFTVGMGETVFTDWIVLQATWKGDSHGEFQAAPLNLKFAWRES